MGNAKYTPGKRHVIPASSGLAGDGGHGHLVQAYSDADPEGAIVAECDNAADAQLDAAAPELLVAAVEVLAGLNARIDAAVAAGQPVPVFDGIADLHAAVTKATGN